MDLKQQLMNQALRLMQDPRVMKAMQDPRVMQGLMGAIQMRARLQQNLESGARVVAKRFNLATEAEVRELRRKLRRLEEELQLRQHNAPPRSDDGTQSDGHAA